MSTDSPTELHLYWRPGCGFCISLRRKLDKLGIERHEHNIWDDPEAASVVRGHANGSETVPTAVIGDIGLVNPSPNHLLAVLGDSAPHLLPDDLEPVGAGPVSRFVGRFLGN